MEPKIFNANELPAGFDVRGYRTNGTLPHEAWIKWDSTLVEVSRLESTAIDDLMRYGLVDDSYNLGDMLAMYQKVSSLTDANVSMDGTNAQGQKDNLTFTEAGIPIPIVSKGFTLTERHYQAALNRGRNISTDTIREAGKIVAEKYQTMCWDGFSNIILNGTQVYGYTNYTARNTLSVSNAWGGGSDDPIKDIADAIQKLVDDGFKGPYVIYVPTAKWMFLQKDYSTLKGNKTYLQRMLDFAGVQEVRMGVGLNSNEFVIVQMTPNVVELKMAQDITAYEEPITKRGVHDFTVMGAMAICIKSDKNGNCGVLHATGI